MPHLVTRSGPLARCLVPALLTVLLVGCGKRPTETQPPAPQYEATVVRTSHGIPHITANDWGSLGFGEAYASAEDQVCNMALALVQSRGESALAFGPGHNQQNTARDVVIKALGIGARSASALQSQPQDIRDWLAGYAAGYNQFLAEHPDGTGSWCDGADWVRPVQPEAFMTQYLTLLYTLPRVAPALLAATLPEVAVEDMAASRDAIPAPQLLATLAGLNLPDMGSNAWSLASERTENGRGILLANPHYPWYGTARFWEKHLTLPGQLDVYGVGLIGTPGVALGFNKDVGWSHTVSNSKRTVIYQLTLNPDNPRQYRWQDGWRDLRAETVTVDVTADGVATPYQHTIWFSHHGPLIALPGLSDNPLTVFAVRDANAENSQTLAQWLAMGKATGMDEFIDAHRQYNAMPWVNTIATSATGRAVYIDNSTVGALSDDTISAWRASQAAVPKLQYLYLTQGLVILDGSTADNDWLDTGATVPGTEPFERRPLIESDQYVFNANDSYWLSDPDNPAQPLSPLYGPTHTPRSLRTRMNVELLKADSPFQYAGEDGKFSIAEIQSALFANDSLAAGLLLPELLAACEKSPQREVSGNSVDLTAACDVLGQWDQTFNLESRGAVLFREWLTRYPYTETQLGGSLFATAFDPARPLNTPSGLGDPDLALDRLAEAVRLLQDAEIALDTPLGILQVGHRMNEVIPLHGGNSYEGIANLQVTHSRSNGAPATPIFTGSPEFVGDSKSLTESGYNIVHGSSFIMTLGYNDQGPVAEALLSYSQSGNPTSPYFSDQTHLYQTKQWRPILFSSDAIAENTVSSRTISSSP